MTMRNQAIEWSGMHGLTCGHEAASGPWPEKVVWSSGPESCKHEYQAGTNSTGPLH